MFLKKEAAEWDKINHYLDTDPETQQETALFSLVTLKTAF
jgi:hypothetical protein